MRIGIYVEVVKAANPTGISRYVKGLVEALLEVAPENEFYLYYQQFPKKNKLNWLVDRANVKHRALWVPKDLIGDHPNIWWKYYLPLRIFLDRIDIFHGPNHCIPLSGGVPSLITIHDLAYYHMEVHGENMDRWMRSLTHLHMQKANKVLAISEATARDCVNQGIESDKVEVVYQGYEAQPKTTANFTLLQRFGLNNNSKYLLFLGTIQPRKNPEYLVKEFAKICNQIEHTLVLAGASGGSSALVDDIIEKNGLHDRIVRTGFISDQERHALYTYADMFLYPSRYEGFGLVILEAMSYGLPVISANNSAIPEAAGDAAILVDIEKRGELANAITHLLSDKKLRQSMIEKGYIQTKRFSWQNAAVSILSIYRSLVRYS